MAHSKNSSRVVRDGDDLLLVLSEELVTAFDIKEGDDLILVDIENGKLTLELARKEE